MSPVQTLGVSEIALEYSKNIEIVTNFIRYNSHTFIDSWFQSTTFIQ